MVETRSNITFAVFVTNRLTKNLDHYHTKAVKTIPQYLKGLQDWRITYNGQEQRLIERYLDCD